MGATDFSKANLKEVSISSDRGVNSASVYNELVVKGAYVTGTVPHNNSAKQQPFVSFSSHDLLEVAENDRNNQACCKILESGAKSAFWVKESLDGGHIIYHLAWRQGNGKVVYLATSDPSLGPANWILERDATHAAHPHRHIYDRDGNPLPPDHKIWKSESIHGQFLQRSKDTEIWHMTEGQCDPLWWTLRSFMLTSSSARTYISEFVKVHGVEFTDQLNVLST